MDGLLQDTEQLKSQVLTGLEIQQEDIRGPVSELQAQVLPDFQDSVIEDPVKKRGVVDKQVVALVKTL
ncbi:hypothetical protein cypCar_00032837 [Cyprinus carpio]|nr:hypothetical protein cypCar_00032837 [Cyprinus carpio]